MRPNYPNLNVARRRLEASVVRLGSTPIFIDRIVRTEQPEPVDVRLPVFIPGQRYRNWTWWDTDFEGGWETMPRWQREALPDFENFEGNLREILVRENDNTRERVRRHLARQQQPRFENHPGEFRAEDYSLQVVPVAGDQPWFQVPMDNEQLNLIPVQLGMARMGSGAVYVERVPCRLYSQGLTVNNMRVQELGQFETAGHGFPLTQNSDLSDCITGKHSSLREALAEIAGSDDITARPFDRHLAISVDHNLGLAYLWYKKARIGWSDTGDRFKIAQPYAFMREYLTEKEVNHDLAA